MNNFNIVSPKEFVNFYPVCDCTINAFPGCGGTTNVGCI